MKLLSASSKHICLCSCHVLAGAVQVCKVLYPDMHWLKLLGWPESRNMVLSYPSYLKHRDNCLSLQLQFESRCHQCEGIARTTLSSELFVAHCNSGHALSWELQIIITTSSAKLCLLHPWESESIKLSGSSPQALTSDHLLLLRMSRESLSGKARLHPSCTHPCWAPGQGMHPG